LSICIADFFTELVSYQSNKKKQSFFVIVLLYEA
jgi:hypothetical protein